jgi:hypothetical protein
MRPQDLFQPPVDNSNSPFLPVLTHLEGLMDAGSTGVNLADVRAVQSQLAVDVAGAGPAQGQFAADDADARPVQRQVPLPDGTVAQVPVPSATYALRPWQLYTAHRAIW